MEQVICTRLVVSGSSEERDSEATYILVSSARGKDSNISKRLVGEESVFCIGLTVQIVSSRLVSSSRGERVVLSISSARGKERVFCIGLAVQVVSSRLDSISRGDVYF